MRGNLKQVRIDSLNRRCLLTFEFNYDFEDACEVANDLYGKEVSIKIKKHSNKRSLDSNALFWVTVNEIANCVHSSKEEVYEELLKKYAPMEFFAIRADVKIEDFFNHYEFYKEKTNPDGTKVNYYKIYKGSSKMDQAEMNELINRTLEEAHELGIISASEADLLE